MLHRISRFALVGLFLAALLLAGGAASPVHAAGEAAYIEDVVHGADIDHIMTLIHDAINHFDGLLLEDHDVVYDALGRTNASLDLLYSSGATGDVFNAAERLLLTQRELLQEVEHATLTGNLADLSTVAPLLIDVAQARLAFERQTSFAHSSHLPSTGSHLNRDLLHNRSLFDRRHLGSTDHGRFSHDPFTRRRLGRSFGGRSFLDHDHSLHRHPGRSFLELRRGRTFDRFGLGGLHGTRLSRFYFGR